MEDSVYVIDENQISTLRNRLLFNQLKIIGFAVVPIILWEYFNLKYLGTLYWLVTCGLIIYFFIICYVSSNKAAKAYRTMQLVLNKEGVERKADGMPYQMIPWTELEIEKKTNGIIHLNNKNVSSFMRKMYGKGRIIVHPEILNRDALLNELFKRSNQY